MGRRLLAGAVVGAVLLVGGACSDDGDGDGAAGTTTGSTDPPVSTTAPEEETTTTRAELTSAVIQEGVEAEHPAEAALVDWSIFRWVSGFGYTATVPEGTTSAQGTAVCAGLAEVLDAYASEDAIAVVAGPGETPLAGRPGPGVTCASR